MFTFKLRFSGSSVRRACQDADDAEKQLAAFLVVGRTHHAAGSYRIQVGGALGGAAARNPVEVAAGKQLSDDGVEPECHSIDTELFMTNMTHRQVTEVASELNLSLNVNMNLAQTYPHPLWRLPWRQRRQHKRPWEPWE